MDEHLRNAFSIAIAHGTEQYRNAAEERAQPHELDEIFIDEIIKSLNRSGYYIDDTMARQKLAAQYPLTYDINLNRLTFFAAGLTVAVMLFTAF